MAESATNSAGSDTGAASTVREWVDLIRAGNATSSTLVAHYADAIESTDANIHAWVDFNRDTATSRATALDDIRRRGEPTGPLHGIPVGVKDIYDTADFKTQYGSAIHDQHQPDNDCAVVEKLKEAGAMVMGKTVTTEFAFMHPSITCNPHNTDYSPGCLLYTSPSPRDS